MSIEIAQTDKTAIAPQRQVSSEEESSAIKEARDKVDRLGNNVWWPKFWLYSALVLGGISAVLIAIFTLRSESITDDLRAAEKDLTTLEMAKIKGDADTKIALINADADKARNTQEELRKDNLTLEGKTEGFRLDIAKANARAAEANKTAEGERLARVKIEEKLAPRSISPQQITGLIWRLKPYAGTPVDILQYGESPEIANFRSLIVVPLRAAGWLPVVSTVIGSGSIIGLSVAVVTDATDAQKLAATTLLSGLNEEGIVAAYGGPVKRDNWPGFVMAPRGEENKALIRIYIGSKP